MQVLIDECLPKRLKRELPGHNIFTVQERGWSGKKNGELLQLSSGQFDVLITGDQSLKFQQNLSQVNIAVVVLVAPNNRLETLKPLMPKVQQVLQTIQPGDLVSINA